MKKVKHKLIIVTMVISLVTAIIITITMTFKSIQTNNKLLDNQIENLNDDYDSRIKEQVEIAISMIDTINEKTKTGELTGDEAKKQSADLFKEFKVLGKRDTSGQILLKE